MGNTRSTRTKKLIPEIDTLLHVSHAVGANAQVVQAGGGNTSVKLGDGTMVIKASGTPLQGMTHDTGWVMVEMKRIKELFRRKELNKLSPQDREKEVLRVLYGSVVKPADARPSVETPLHALLNRVVIHTHPVAAAALLCHPQGEKILRKIVKGDAEKPLWIPYVDPGATLAFAVAEKVAHYREAFGRLPTIILQQNHGIFVSADSPTAAIHLHNDLLQRIEAFFAEERAPAMGRKTRDALDLGMKKVLRAVGKKGVLRFSSRFELTEAARSSLSDALKDALTPDHVVYMGPCALFVPPIISAAGVEKAVGVYLKKWGILPKVIVVKGAGVVLVGESEAKCIAAEALACSAIQAARMNGERLKFLSAANTHFIMNWEAEHYRAKQN